MDRVHDHADVVAEALERRERERGSIARSGAARLVDHHLEQRSQLRALGVRNSMLYAGVLPEESLLPACLDVARREARPGNIVPDGT